MSTNREYDKSLAVISKRIGQPLHEQVRRYLRELIETRYEDGERFFTERELIQQLRVSQPTVRRALAELAAEGLLERGVGRGTFVKKASHDRSVGVFIPKIDSFLQLSIIRSLGALCSERDYGFHIYLLRPNRSMKEACEVLKRSPREERIIFSGTSSDDTWALYHELDSRGYHSLYLSGYRKNYPGSSVFRDDELGVRLAIEHLMSLGHRRIVFIVNETTSLETIRLRLSFIRQIIEEKQLVEATILDCANPIWGDSFAAAFDKMDEAMALSPKPTAICPLSASGSWGVLRYLMKKGVRVPEDISVFSFDNLPTNEQIYPALTSLTSSPEMESQALEILWNEKVSVQNVVVPPRLIIRESTGPVRSS